MSMQHAARQGRNRTSLTNRGSRATDAVRQAAARQVENLEDRVLFSVFTVTSNNDNPGAPNVAPPDMVVPGITLRDAITAANTKAGADVINFAIPGPGPKQILIQTSPLPAIVDPLAILGNTQNGSTPGQPLINIDGSALPAGSDGLVFTNGANAGNNTVQNLIINRFKGDGIQFLETNAVDHTDTVTDSFIGVSQEGTNAFTPGNGGSGILFTGEARAVITNNLISGNGAYGINIFTGTANISGNRIGVQNDGNTAFGNGIFGIQVNNDPIPANSAFTISNNTVSGNGGNSGALADHGGILLGGAGGVSVSGNRIGVNVGNTAPAGNQGDGIRIISDANAISGNVISNNTGDGIDVSGDNNNIGVVPVANGTTGAANTITNNGEAGVALRPSASG